MSALYSLFRILDVWKPAHIAYAHCDVPCGIYRTNPSVMAADTVVKMVEKVLELRHPKEGTHNEHLAFKNSIIRMVKTKEEHAQLCKQELLILWTDYFKSEHLQMFPNLHEAFWKAAKLCSKNKQNIDLEAARELREAVGEIAAMFDKAEAAKKK